MSDDQARSDQAAVLRRRAEEFARETAAQSPEHLDALPPEATRQALHEVRVHQIELEMQNEELRRAQLELEESRARYFDLYDLAPVGYCTLNEHGLILEANLTAAELLSVARSELVKQPITRFILKEDQDIYYLHRKNLFEKGAPQACELRMVKKDGTQFWARLEATAAQDADGVPVCRLVMSDIHERKHMEQERAELLEAERSARGVAERATRVKDEFLAVISHELRTPLGAILGWASLAKRDKTLDTVYALGIIERSAMSLTQLIDDLLDTSRITSGKVRLSMRTVDPEQLIRTILEDFRLAADTKKIAFEQQIQPDLRPIRCDPSRIQQVVRNLLSNAIKFTPEGGRILVRVEQNASRWTIRVQDSGKGISPKFLPQMFGKFRQADVSTTRQHGGLGLGLAIVGELVEMHGGTVQAESEGEGRGATFTVTLPTAAPSSADGDAERAGFSGDAQEGMLPDGLSVLVVDDEIEVCELIGRVLTESGARVLTATCASEAWRTLMQDKPDVLVSDISMRGEDGYSLIRKIRSSQDSCADMACIALTAMVRPEDRERAFEAGFDEHLPKTIHPSEVVVAVREMAGKSMRRSLNRQTQQTKREQLTVNAGARSGPAHILLAEDNKTISEMVKSSLEQAGHRVSVVASIADGATTAGRTPVDLLVSDFRLEDGTGWGLMAKLRAIRMIPGIMMSGYADRIYIEQSRAAGFTEYLVKPVDLDELCMIVAQVLDVPAKESRGCHRDQEQTDNGVRP